jgi:hypothetical protein
MDINIGTFMDMGTGHGHGYHAVKDSEMTWAYSTVNFLEEKTLTVKNVTESINFESAIFF